MHEHHVVSLIVIEERDSGKMPIGLLTDRISSLRLFARDLDARTIPVSEVMATDVVAVRDEDDMKDALGLMRRRGVRRPWHGRASSPNRGAPAAGLWR